jgi:hypothetical protein
VLKNEQGQDRACGAAFVFASKRQNDVPPIWQSS